MLILFLVIWLIIFSIYMIYFNIVNRKTLKMSKEMLFLNYAYKIDILSLDLKKLIFQISIINSFIFSTAFIITYYITSFLFKMLILFGVVFILILICYSILGRYYQRRGKK